MNIQTNHPVSILSVCFLLAVMATLANGCSQSKKLEIAEQGAKVFHSRFDSGQFGVIYSEAGEEIHKAKSELEWTSILQLAQEKLGKVKESQLKNWKVMSSDKDTIVNANYTTRFTKAEANEEFTWRVTDSRAILIGYYVDSPALYP